MGPEGPPGPPGDGVTDHSKLSNLSADDHPQYLLAGSRESSNGFAVTGTLNSGALPATGAGTRMVWWPGRAAFRAGHVRGGGSSYWDLANIGVGSVAFGENTRASGNNSVAMGLESSAAGHQSVALGNNSTATGDRAFAVGGTASGPSAVALGGNAQATGDDAVALGPSAIAGGLGSIAIGPSIANGSYGVAIGLQNSASGNFSLALGKNARTAYRQGAIVISDASAGFSSDSLYPTANNQIVMRGTGGIKLFTSQNLSTGAELLPGGGSWNMISDRNRKQDLLAVDGEDILRRMREIPVTSWSYIAQSGSGIRHIGPMAQDWERMFGLSGDTTTINSGDMAGVTFAGVQALEARTTSQAATIQALERRIRELEALVEELARRRD
jgi:hypothetical protein